MNFLLIILGSGVLSSVLAVSNRRRSGYDRLARPRAPRQMAQSFLQLVGTWLARGRLERARIIKMASFAFLTFLGATEAFAQPSETAAGGEANLKLPDLSQVQFLGVDGHKLLMIGILFCIFGLLFGLVIYSRLKNLPVHNAMAEVSQLIWETCKTYLVTQGKFLALL